MPSSPSLRQETEGLADSGLRCPACEYNLTGVAENRCPECGTAFDPEQLKAILAGAPAPIPVWDDESQNVFVRFAKICLLTWFQPTRIGRMFPRTYSVPSALKFRWAVVAATALAYCLATVPAQGISALLGIMVASLPVLTGVVLSEALLAIVIGESLEGFNPQRPRPLGLRASDSLGGLVGFFRSFLLLQAVVVAVGEVLTKSPVRLDPLAFLVSFYVIPVWWWGALAAAVAVRPGRWWGKILAVFLIPLVVGLAMMPTLFIGALVSGLLWP